MWNRTLYVLIYIYTNMIVLYRMCVYMWLICYYTGVIQMLGYSRTDIPCWTTSSVRGQTTGSTGTSCPSPSSTGSPSSISLILGGTSAVVTVNVHPWQLCIENRYFCCSPVDSRSLIWIIEDGVKRLLLTTKVLHSIATHVRDAIYKISVLTNGRQSSLERAQTSTLNSPALAQMDSCLRSYHTLAGYIARG